MFWKSDSETRTFGDEDNVGTDVFLLIRRRDHLVGSLRCTLKIVLKLGKVGSGSLRGECKVDFE